MCMAATQKLGSEFAFSSPPSAENGGVGKAVALHPALNEASPAMRPKTPTQN